MCVYQTRSKKHIRFYNIYITKYTIEEKTTAKHISYINSTSQKH